VFDPHVEVVWGADMPDVGTYYGLEAQGKRRHATDSTASSVEVDVVNPAP
jgi:hypothetical protein